MAKAKIGAVQKLAEGKFRIRVQRGRKVDGKPLVKSETFYGTEEQASLRAAQIALDLGRSVNAPDMTLREYYFDVFRKAHSVRGKQRSTNTLNGYDSQMLRNVLPVIGDVFLNNITHAMVRSCVLSASSPSGTKRVLRAVLRAAYDDELMTEKPFDRRIPTHSAKRTRHDPWSRFEVAEALSKFRGRDDELELYLILGLSGLSKEEALGVRKQDIRRETVYSFVSGEQVETLLIYIEQAYTDLGGVDDLKNDFRRRIVPVLPSARERLEQLIESSDKSPLERLVSLRSDTLYKSWKRHLKNLGLRYIPPKLLRHTSDTLALASGVSSDLNDRMHGRTQSQTTYAHYFRPDLSLMEHASSQIDSLLGVNPTASDQKQNSGDTE